MAIPALTYLKSTVNRAGALYRALGFPPPQMFVDNAVMRTWNENAQSQSVVVQPSEDWISSSVPRSAQVTLPATIGATDASFLFIAPCACTIERVDLVASGGVATSDTDYWSFMVSNITATADLMSAAKTTKTTGGTAITADTVYPFTLDQNQNLEQGDILELALTETVTGGGPSDILDAIAIVTYRPRNTTNTVYSFRCPKDLTIESIYLIADTTVTQSDTNYWSLRAHNSNGDYLGAAKTTQTTGGFEITANTPWAILTTAALDQDEGWVIDIVATRTAVARQGPVDIQNSVIVITYRAR